MEETTHEKILLEFKKYMYENERFENKGIIKAGIRSKQSLSNIKNLIMIRKKEIREKQKERNICKNGIRQFKG